jgi:hypothetical protein
MACLVVLSVNAFYAAAQKRFLSFLFDAILHGL